MNQNGNVLFIILIAVALFTAFSYAVTSSTRSGSGDASKENITLIASQLTQYGTALENAILRMRMTNGCTDTQISFENPIIAGYTNTSAPANYTCHIFRPEGGGISYLIPPTGANTLTTTYNGNALQDRWPYVFSGDHCSLGVGTDGSTSDCRAVNSMELIVYLPIRNLDLCNEINKKLGNGFSSPPAATGYSCGSAATPCYGMFTGASTYRTFYNNLPANTRSACVQTSSVFPFYTGNIYYFYHILIAR